MTPSQIGKQLHALVLDNSHDFSPHYNLFEREFIEWLTTFNGIKTDVRLDLRSTNQDQVKLAAIMSDFTSIFPYHPEKFLYTFDPRRIERKIVGPKKYLDRISNDIPHADIYAGYGCVSEEEIENVFEEFLPLIEHGKVMIRPEKIIFSVRMGHDSLANVHPADANGPADEWRAVNYSKEQFSFPVLLSENELQSFRTISDIVIPYITGISMKDFSKILIDEEDMLSSLRIQLKSYVKMFKEEPRDINQFNQDVIQPKIDTINRKFKSISNIHRLKVAGATVGTLSLSLLALTQTSLTAALSQFISFGIGTVGFIKSEAEYKDAVEKIKDNPEYLLWRLQKRIMY